MLFLLIAPIKSTKCRYKYFQRLDYPFNESDALYVYRTCTLVNNTEFVEDRFTQYVTEGIEKREIYKYLPGNLLNSIDDFYNDYYYIYEEYVGHDCNDKNKTNDPYLYVFVPKQHCNKQVELIGYVPEVHLIVDPYSRDNHSSDNKKVNWTFYVPAYEKRIGMWDTSTKYVYTKLDEENVKIVCSDDLAMFAGAGSVINQCYCYGECATAEYSHRYRINKYRFVDEIEKGNQIHNHYHIGVIVFLACFGGMSFLALLVTIAVSIIGFWIYKNHSIYVGFY